MLKLPFLDDDIMQSTASADNSSKRRPQDDDPLKGMKTFGERSNKDIDCMNQANFVALAMERKRRRHTEEIIYQAASKLTELFLPSSPNTHKTKLSSVMDILEMRQHHDDTSSVTSSNSDWSKRASEIEIKDYGISITSKESWQSFQDFSDVLKSEAMLRQMRR
jgi:hypothetical protein